MNVRPLPLILAFVVLVAAGAALWFVMTRPVPQDPSGVATSTPTGLPAAEKVLISDTGTYHEITATYPSATPLRESAGTKADAEAVASLKVFAEKEAARFRDSSVGELTAEDIRVQGLGGERKYVLDMDYEIRESPDSVSYVYHMYADTLGAHPNAYYRTFTFDKKSGAELHLDDLFSSEAYLEVLSDISRASLRATLGADASPDMLEAGTTPFPDNFQNFYLDGEMFVIVFPPYQVGPWAIGTQEVRIPRSDLSAVLRTSYR